MAFSVALEWWCHAGVMPRSDGACVQEKNIITVFFWGSSCSSRSYEGAGNEEICSCMQVQSSINHLVWSHPRNSLQGWSRDANNFFSCRGEGIVATLQVLAAGGTWLDLSLVITCEISLHGQTSSNMELQGVIGGSFFWNDGTNNQVCASHSTFSLAEQV